MTSEEKRAFKNQIKEAMQNTFGFAPAAGTIEILETGSNGLCLLDAAWTVNGKGYSWNRFSCGGEVVRATDYDIKG